MSDYNKGLDVFVKHQNLAAHYSLFCAYLKVINHNKQPEVDEDEVRGFISNRRKDRPIFLIDRELEGFIVRLP